MTVSDIVHLRLQQQQITQQTFEHPAGLVAWLGAVQAQDYPAGLWATGLRLQNAAEATIEQALADRTIVRTWPMRGTLHFVAAEDVRWMLKLLTPRIVAGSAGRHRQIGLDQTQFDRSKEAFIKALQGGKQLTRSAMYKVLEAANISPAGQRGIHILAKLAQEGIICFGTKEGKQQTFVLLDEWVPSVKIPARDEALAELARRYFTGHGPATLQDFVWWSGLTVADAKAGLEMAKPHLVSETVGGQTYWFSPLVPMTDLVSPIAHLLPVYDEYTVGYKDRSAVLDPEHTTITGNGIFRPVLSIDGKIAGTWKRTLRKDRVLVEISTFISLNKAMRDAIEMAASCYGEFINKRVEVQTTRI